MNFFTKSIPATLIKYTPYFRFLNLFYRNFSSRHIIAYLYLVNNLLIVKLLK